MIVNKSMYPLQTGFGVISKMQDKFATLQMQMGTGEKATKLSEMGRDLPMSLSVRQRLGKIEGFTGNIEKVNLRLSFLDKTMSRFDKLESEARSSALQGQYGTDAINMATLPGLSKARFDEVVDLLNSEVAGRYLFGGSETDTAPVADPAAILDGLAGKAGFKAVVTERKAADLGESGQGRLVTSLAAGTTTVDLTEDGVHPFGLKVSTVSTTSGTVSVSQPAAGTLPLGDGISVTFAAAPAAQIEPGHTISMGFALPDGTQTQITLKAVTTANATGSVDEFVIGADAEETATNFQTALEAKLVDVGGKALSGASTFAAAQNFFNGAGEPVLRVQGSPATATSLRVATEDDTVMWYRGQSPAIASSNLGRLSVATAGNTVTLSENAPSSNKHGFQITGVSADTAGIGTTFTAADPSSVSLEVGTNPLAGEKVSITLAEPNGAARTVELEAVVGPAGAGQFSIGADTAATARNLSASLKTVLTEASLAAHGNPRQSVTAQIDDTTRVSYGMEANESGFLRMMQTMGAMSVETYPSTDPTSRARFDAVATRMHLELSESHNGEAGSIEVLTMELGVARGALESATKRHTDYKAQLSNLLSDIETVSKEDVAMEILALQTRLQASFQATSMVSQLSLVNFL